MNHPTDNFPVHALPEQLRGALDEAAANVQAPVPMLVSSMLAAASAATQGLANVKRPNGMRSPISLMFITIAESGERKSVCDEVFTRGIRAFEARELADEKARSSAHEAQVFIWKRKEAHLKNAISKAVGEVVASSSGDTQSIQDLQAQLASHIQAHPEHPRMLQMLIQDSTPEGIMSRVLKHCPLLFLNCDEGGKILNGYLARSLALLNTMRDGSAQHHDRKTSDRQIVTFVRLSSHIQAQPKTIQKFFDNQGDLARDSGFLARNWVNYPSSTQGYRFIGTDESQWSNVGKFHLRITELLEEAKNLRNNKIEDLPNIEFSQEAAQAWVDFFNYVEAHQQPNCIYSGIRDAASKTAENVARLAAILHLFEGQTGPISQDIIRRAIPIGLWFLDSFRMIFDPPMVPTVVRDAQKLEAWLWRHYRHTGEHVFRKNYLLQHGPLRTKAELDPALTNLIAYGRATMFYQHKTACIGLVVQQMPAQPMWTQSMPVQQPRLLLLGQV